MANEESIKIVSFITPESGGSCVRAWLTLSKTSSLLCVIFQSNTKRHIDDVSIDSYYKTAYIAAFFCHWVLFILWWAVYLTRSYCTVSDTQVTSKTHGLLVCFPYWTSRIHQEYIIAFQDKLNYREITGREIMYKHFMMWKFNMKNQYEKSVLLFYCSDRIQEIDIKRYIYIYKHDATEKT